MPDAMSRRITAAVLPDSVLLRIDGMVIELEPAAAVKAGQLLAEAGRRAPRAYEPNFLVRRTRS